MQGKTTDLLFLCLLEDYSQEKMVLDPCIIHTQVPLDFFIFCVFKSRRQVGGKIRLQENVNQKAVTAL